MFQRANERVNRLTRIHQQLIIHVERHLQPVSYQRMKIEQIMESNSSLIISTLCLTNCEGGLILREYLHTITHGAMARAYRRYARLVGYPLEHPARGSFVVTRPPLPTLDRRIHEHVVMPTSSSGHGKPRMKVEERGRAARRWCNPPLRAATAMYTRWYLEVAHSDPKL